MSTAQEDFQEMGVMFQLLVNRLNSASQNHGEMVKTQATRIAELEAQIAAFEDKHKEVSPNGEIVDVETV